MLDTGNPESFKKKHSYTSNSFDSPYKELTTGEELGHSFEEEEKCEAEAFCGCVAAKEHQRKFLAPYLFRLSQPTRASLV